MIKETVLFSESPKSMYPLNTVSYQNKSHLKKWLLKAKYIFTIFYVSWCILRFNSNKIHRPKSYICQLYSLRFHESDSIDHSFGITNFKLISSLVHKCLKQCIWCVKGVNVIDMFTLWWTLWGYLEIGAVAFFECFKILDWCRFI